MSNAVKIDLIYDMYVKSNLFNSMDELKFDPEFLVSLPQIVFAFFRMTTLLSDNSLLIPQFRLFDL